MFLTCSLLTGAVSDLLQQEISALIPEKFKLVLRSIGTWKKISCCFLIWIRLFYKNQVFSEIEFRSTSFKKCRTCIWECWWRSRWGSCRALPCSTRRRCCSSPRCPGYTCSKQKYHIYIYDNNRTYSEILELVYLNLNIYCYKYILYNKKYPAIKEYQKNWSGISKTQWRIQIYCVSKK